MWGFLGSLLGQKDILKLQSWLHNSVDILKPLNMYFKSMNYIICELHHSKVNIHFSTQIKHILCTNLENSDENKRIK